MYEYEAICTEVYDGDTITVDIDLGFDAWLKSVKVRLLDIDTPEVRGSERNEGIIVRDWLRGQILKKEVTLKTHKSPNRGKYGRWLATVFKDGVNLNEAMIETGMARRAFY